MSTRAFCRSFYNTVLVSCAAAAESGAASRAYEPVPVVPGVEPAPLPVAPAKAPSKPEPAEGYTHVREAGGSAKRLPNGLFRVRLADGATIDTHGADPAPQGHQHSTAAPPSASGPNPAFPATIGGHYVLPSENIRPLCPSSVNDATFGVIYAHPPGGDRYAGIAANVASLFRGAHNSFAWNGAWSGGSIVKLRVFCGGVGKIQVPNCSFNSIVTAARQVYAQPRTKYVIYADCPDPDGAGGRGEIRADTRPSSDNLNNQPPGSSASMYSVTWGCCWHLHTSLHEMGHTLGAVQSGAPQANGQFHCNDGVDVMCYAEAGQPYTETFCPDASLPPLSPWAHIPPFDCRYDTYFTARPGATGYLSSHWNIARSYNDFVVGGPTN